MNSASIGPLAPGIYILTVTDANGCQAVEEVQIATSVVNCDNFQLSISKEDPLCYGSSDGIVSVEPSGGSLPYSYLWSDGSIVSDLVDRPVGVCIP